MKKPKPLIAAVAVISTVYWVDFYVEDFIRNYFHPPRPVWVHVENYVDPPRIIGYPITVILLILYVYLWRSYFKRLREYKTFIAEKIARDAASAATSRASGSWPPPPT